MIYPRILKNQKSKLMKKSEYVEMVAVMHQMFCLENNLDMSVVLGMWEVLLSSFGIESDNLTGWDEAADLELFDEDQDDEYLGFVELINCKQSEKFESFSQTCDQFFLSINNVKIVKEKERLIETSIAA